MIYFLSDRERENTEEKEWKNTVDVFYSLTTITLLDGLENLWTPPCQLVSKCMK